MLYYIGYYIGDLLPPFLTALLSMRITDCGMIAQICKLIKMAFGFVRFVTLIVNISV